MNRGYQTAYGTGFQSQSNQRYTASNGFNQRNPLYPIGPTLSKPEFKPITRGMSPSPYLNRQGMKPPSYEDWHLKKAQQLQSRSRINYEQRQRSLISRTQRQIQEQKHRRQKIRVSYERQVNALNELLNKNIQTKQKLVTEIQTLQQTYDEIHLKLMSLQPPDIKINTSEALDRKQQEMIVLKNKLMTTMRENERELIEQEEIEEKQWEERFKEKEKILFRLEQNLREKRIELHQQKQKSFEKPDFLMIEEQIRATQYNNFLYRYEEFEQRIKRMLEEREKSNKQLSETISLKKTMISNLLEKRLRIKREVTSITLKIEELQRTSKQMQGLNQNLSNQLDRKETLIEKYRTDINNLNQQKRQLQGELNNLITMARSNQENPEGILSQLESQIKTISDEVKFQESNNSRLKNQYQKLSELLFSASSRNIHQTFNQNLSREI